MLLYVTAGGCLYRRGFKTLAFFWAGVQAGGGKNLDATLTMTAEASSLLGLVCVFMYVDM